MQLTQLLLETWPLVGELNSVFVHSGLQNNVPCATAYL